MPFFDPAADAQLLRPEYRSSPTVPTIAAQAEADVLGHYTKRRRDRRNTNLSTYWSVGTTYGDFMTQDIASPLAWGPSSKPVVWLFGFMADPTACEAQLADAIKRTVALVIEWRMAQSQISMLETNRSSADHAHVGYRDNVSDVFPKGWDRYIRIYDAREQRF